ncbi:MAG: hypothetical protein ACLFN5_01590 [bacterium]
MTDQQIWWLVGMIVGAFLIGLVVLIVNPEYRFSEIIETNSDYYANVEVHPPR